MNIFIRLLREIIEYRMNNHNIINKESSSDTDEDENLSDASEYIQPCFKRRRFSQGFHSLPDEITMNPDGARQFLKEYNWPNGLQQSMLNALSKLPIRFIILDDSGSMAVSDGAKLLGDGANKTQVSCTRWSEMLLNANFYCGLADAAKSMTEFRLLNNGAPCVVGGQGDDSRSGYHHMCI